MFTMSARRAGLIVVLTAAAVSAGRLSGAEIQVGLSHTDITPPIGGKTTGYSSAKPTDGVHDPVIAQAIVMKSDRACVALVVCDLCIFNSPWLHNQMEAIGIDRLLLMNTHTHAGPNLRQDDFPSSEMPWRQTVEKRLLETIKKAKQDLFPAFFAAGKGYIQLGYNRLVQRDDYAVTHFENPDRIPYGNVDPTVGVIRITDDKSAVRAVMVTYACHPVVLGPRNRKISADYPGVTRQFVEDRLGKDTICVFIQGAAGDVNPLMLARGENRDADFTLVDRMGQLLATEVLRVLSLMEDEPGRSRGFAAMSTSMELGHRWKPNETMTLGVTSLLVNDDIGIVTMPGEPFHKFQVDFREKANTPHAFLFGYCCNGPYAWPSYLPDLVSAARGGYGASDTTRAEVGAGERLVNKGLAQLYKLQGRLKSQPQRHVFGDEGSR